MVTQVITCYHCGSENIVKNGRAPNGKQKYLCHDCGRQSREHIPTLTPMTHKGVRRSCALTRSALASEALPAPSVFHATPLPVGSKKAARLPSLERTLLPAPSSQKKEGGHILLELDELWSFVGRKADKRWVWIALARHTRRVLAYDVIGDRSERSCRRSWERIPESYKGGGGCSTRAIFGRHTGRLSRRSVMRRWAREAESWRMWRGGTTPCASVWLASFARRSLSPSRTRCTRSV